MILSRDFVQCQTKMWAFLHRMCSEFKQIELNWNRIVHQISAPDANQPSSQERSLRTADAFPVVASLGNAIFRRERSDDRKCVCGSQATRNNDRSPIWKQKHLKTSDIFSLPRISTKDFPYIKGKIDRSIGINYSSVNFKWTQVFLCCQSFDRRGQWIF